MTDLSLPKQKRTLDHEIFDGMLMWLSPDREQAGKRYEEIRSRLINGFRKHGCAIPEELADETINRVARRLPDIIETYEGEPVRYFYGVAHHVHMEYMRRPEIVPLTQMDIPDRGSPTPLELLDDVDSEQKCLKHCIGRLTPQNREMILQYYRGERQLKIKLRKELAERLGIKLENLRLRAQRVRADLKKCIINCLDQTVAA